MLMMLFQECQVELLMPFFCQALKRVKKEQLLIEWNNSGEMEPMLLFIKTGLEESLEDFSLKVVFITAHHSKTSLKKNSKMPQ